MVPLWYRRAGYRQLLTAPAAVSLTGVAAPCSSLALGPYGHQGLGQEGPQPPPAAAA